MNLIEPPKGRIFAWAAKRRAAVADYFRAVFQLSKLTINLTYQGRKKKVVVTYTGRNAELNVKLDDLLG